MSSIWYSIILVGIFTFLTRLSFILLSDKIKLQPNVQRALRFVPIAVLSAIVFPELVQNNATQYFYYFPRIIAGMFAIFIAWRTRNILLTIITGMLVLYFLSYIVNL
jgi:branched-subunit amino acid transport protein